jgi:hypothetical protein
MNGAERIAAERQRQIKVEGYDAEHDAGAADELALAAACYALPTERRKVRRTLMAGSFEVQVKVPLFSELWPWRERFWKPTPDSRIRELEKAGALIAAAIDALEDSALPSEGQPK